MFKKIAMTLGLCAVVMTAGMATANAGTATQLDQWRFEQTYVSAGAYCPYLLRAYRRTGNRSWLRKYQACILAQHGKRPRR